jgi:hypothetical protein
MTDNWRPKVVELFGRYEALAQEQTQLCASLAAELEVLLDLIADLGGPQLQQAAAARLHGLKALNRCGGDRVFH